MGLISRVSSRTYRFESPVLLKKNQNQNLNKNLLKNPSKCPTHAKLSSKTLTCPKTCNKKPLTWPPKPSKNTTSKRILPLTSRRNSTRNILLHGIVLLDEILVLM